LWLEWARRYHIVGGSNREYCWRKLLEIIWLEHETGTYMVEIKTEIMF
jgi:hypothetical protein